MWHPEAEKELCVRHTRIEVKSYLKLQTMNRGGVLGGGGGEEGQEGRSFEDIFYSVVSSERYERF